MKATGIVRRVDELGRVVLPIELRLSAVGAAGVALLLVAMIAHVVWDARRVARRLQALEERGIRRRSAAAADARP